MHLKKRPLTLIVLDGYGHNPDAYGNAVVAANQPHIDSYFKDYPSTLIEASGMDVGLPHGQMGNSEVGHTNIGAGRIVYQDLTRITKAIEDGDFFENEVLNRAVDHCIEKNSYLHVFGLLSDGGVHSHNTHIYAVIELAKRKGLDRVILHAFTDGRDVSPTSSAGFVGDLLEKMEEIGVGHLGTVSGRYYAMDRDKRWERIEKAYDAVVRNIGVKETEPVAAIRESYQNGVTDEFLVPMVFEHNRGLFDGDAVIFSNFRPDRGRELTRAIVDPDFDGFDRGRGKFDVNYVCMTQYDATMPNVSVAFKPEDLTKTYGEIVAKHGLRQLRIAETEKYAHVTFFFNGGVEEKFENEDRKLIQSPKVATYDMQPEMSAYTLTDEICESIESGKYDTIIANYANPDMVGHTGSMDATVEAIEHVDKCMKRCVEASLKVGGIVIITADHGNCETMMEEDGSPITAHSTNPVPICFIGEGLDFKLREGGRLSDIAPSMLDLLGIEKPIEMTGQSLILH